jgi:hypothetical protein
MWAALWAVVAVLIGLAIDPDGSMDEMWPAIGAYPGFLGGVVFSVVLGVAARRRRLDDLSLARVGAWGALAGLLVGTLPFLVGEPTTEVPLWLLALGVIGTITLLSAASAAGSLAIARRADDRSDRSTGGGTALREAASRGAIDASAAPDRPQLAGARPPSGTGASADAIGARDGERTTWTGRSS